MTESAGFAIRVDADGYIPVDRSATGSRMFKDMIPSPLESLYNLPRLDVQCSMRWSIGNFTRRVTCWLSRG